MSANCAPAQLRALTDFGYHVGLAFQIIDDILDGHADQRAARQTAGKDTAAQKATYPAIVGFGKSREIARASHPARICRLENLQGRAAALEGLAAYLLQRDK